MLLNGPKLGYRINHNIEDVDDFLRGEPIGERRQLPYCSLLSYDMNNRFTIELSSDLDYEEMVVYISLDDQLLATLNCEKGINDLEIELHPLIFDKVLSVPFSDYLKALEFAKATLLKSQMGQS